MDFFRVGQFIKASISMSALSGPKEFSLEGFIQEIDKENQILHLKNGATIYVDSPSVKITILDNILDFSGKNFRK